MDRREEYAICLIVLLALVIAIVSMFTGSRDIGILSAVIAVIAVVYAIYIIHVELSDHESNTSYKQGYLEGLAASGSQTKKMVKQTSEPDDYSAPKEETSDDAPIKVQKTALQEDQDSEMEEEPTVNPATPGMPASNEPTDEEEQPKKISKPKKQPKPKMN